MEPNSNDYFALVLPLSLMVIIVVLFFLVSIYVIRPFFQALLSGIPVTFSQVLMMRFRKSPVNLIISQLVRSRKAGLYLNLDDLEAFALTGGNLEKVVDGLIFAKAHNINLDFKQACQMVLQKRDIEKELAVEK